MGGAKDRSITQPPTPCPHQGGPGQRALHGSGEASQDLVIERRLRSPAARPPACPQGSGFPLSAIPTRAWESRLSRKISSFSIRKSLPLPPLPPLFLGLSTRAETLRSSEGAMIEGRQAFQPAPRPPGTRLSHLPAGAASTWGILPPVPPDSASHSSPALAPPQPAKLGGTGQRQG